MIDLELTKRCAEAIGLELCERHSHDWPMYFDGALGEWGADIRYDPLHDDAQAMALVKKFHLDIDSAIIDGEKLWGWRVMASNVSHARNLDLNRAICECVAKIGANHD